MEISLLKSIFYNDVEAVEKYLSSHEDISHEAIFSLNFDKPDEIQLVIPKDNLRLIHIAAAGDAMEVFLLLEKYGFSINDVTAANYLPIHYACNCSSYEIASYIFSINPDMAKIEQQGVEFHLLYLTATGGDPGIMELLFKNGVNPKSSANYRNDPIGKAVQSKNMECVKVLLSHGERPPQNDNYTLPMSAAINIQPKAVEYLLDVDPNPINYCSPVKHQSLLGLCCFYGVNFKQTILNILRRADNVEPNIPDVDGPVHWICTIVDIDIAKEFLKHDINVNRLDQDGKTGFHYLFDKPDKEATILELMGLLIDAGFDVNIRREPRPNMPSPPSVLEHFCSSIKKSYPIISFLIDNGADIYALDKNGNRLCDTIMSRRDAKLKKLFQKSKLYVPDKEVKRKSSKS